MAGVINSSNKGSTTLRNAPDVAAEANFDNSTVNQWHVRDRIRRHELCDLRDGLVLLRWANQQSVAAGKSTLGFLNPAIYNIGVSSTYTSNFHDITSGNNKPSAGTGSGFNAVTGYDLVTGWGSPTGQTLINTLTGGSTATDSGLRPGCFAELVERDARQDGNKHDSPWATLTALRARWH